MNNEQIIKVVEECMGELSNTMECCMTNDEDSCYGWYEPEPEDRWRFSRDIHADLAVVHGLLKALSLVLKGKPLTE